MNFQILILQCLALLRSVFDVSAFCYNVVAVTDQSNTLQSPGYPYKYFSNENCTWTLIAPENYRIELNFIELETEGNDFVRVYEGDNLFGTLIAFFWGSNLPPNVYSIGSNMTVNFRSDSYTSFKGFSATFKTVKQPEFVSKPSDMEVARDSGQSINMTCRVTGSPTPEINWTRDGVAVVTDGDRIIIQPEGDLEITDVTYSDRGTYKCRATNVLGYVEAEATLTVRNRTIIKRDYPSNPVHKFAADGSPVHITCTLTEYDKMLNVSVEWKREDERINASSNNRITIINNNNKKGQRIISSKLTIRNVTVEDAGRYYCVATTRMDEYSDYVQLNVISKPSPPRMTNIQCYAKEAEVSWQSTAGAPASDFIIQYRTSFMPDVWETAIENISATEDDYNVVRVPLRPWQNYTFRVLAHNEGGFSDPSKRFPVTCTTPDDVPRKHPENVSAQRKKPASLVITWTPLSLIDHQGPQLYYEVWWKPNNPNSIWQSVELMDWNEGEYVVDVERVPQEYVVFVLAGNVNGVAVQQAQRVYAYAGVATTVSRSDYKAQRAAARLNGSSV